MVSLQMVLDQLVAPIKLRFKDNCKSILKTGNILRNWNDTVKDRVKWRSMIKTVSDKLNISRRGKYERVRERIEEKIEFILSSIMLDHESRRIYRGWCNL